MKMFPSRHMLDYMTEINRLFPKTPENEALQAQSLFGAQIPSPSSQFGAPNRLSSSTDSTSPDTFPDITTFQVSTPEFKLLSNTSSPQSSASDTPIGARRRPIIGRKIFSTPERVPEIPLQSPPITHWNEPDFTLQREERPMSNAHLIQQANYRRNVYYELFPPENKGFEFKTPVKVQNSTTPGNYSSPVTEDAKAIALYKGNPKSPKYAASTSSQDDSWRMCTFCRKNGETPMVYMTHKVKERVGNDFVVTCPILRSHVCPTCGGTGDSAHTITYCPVLRHRNHGLPLQSTTITLKNTRVKSNGRKRF